MRYYGATCITLLCLLVACSPVAPPPAAQTPTASLSPLTTTSLPTASSTTVPATLPPAPIPTDLPEPTLPPVTLVGVTIGAPINLRSGPGLDYVAISQLDAGMPVTVIGRNTHANWLAIRHDDADLWLYGDLLQVDGDIATLEVLTPQSESTSMTGLDLTSAQNLTTLPLKEPAWLPEGYYRNVWSVTTGIGSAGDEIASLIMSSNPGVDSYQQGKAFEMLLRIATYTAMDPRTQTFPAGEEPQISELGGIDIWYFDNYCLDQAAAPGLPQDGCPEGLVRYSDFKAVWWMQGEVYYLLDTGFPALFTQEEMLQIARSVIE